MTQMYERAGTDDSVAERATSAKPAHDGGVLLMAGSRGVVSGEHLSATAVRAVVDEFWTGLGGRDFFTALAVEFYRQVAQDDVLAPLFPDERWDVHARRLTAHFVVIWERNDLTAAWDPRMHRAHAHRLITRAQRLRWLALMRKAGENLGAPADLRDQLLQILKIASGEMMAVSRGAAIARGESFHWDGTSA